MRSFTRWSLSARWGNPPTKEWSFARIKDRAGTVDQRAVLSDEVGARSGPVCAGCGAHRRDGSWCPFCLERYEQVAQPPPDPPRVAPPREYSRTNAGPTSFGLVGRLLWSVLPALVAYFAVRNVMRSRGDATVAYYLVIAVPTLVLVAGFLAFVWRKERVS